MSAPINLSQLPAPEVVETLDYETLLAERKARLVELHPKEDQAALEAQLSIESDPIVKLLEENAYRELVLRQRINESAKSVMLAYAHGSDLDQIGANYDVERLIVDEGDPAKQPPEPPVYENDEDFRSRIQLSFERLSVAGPEGAYVYHAKTADGRVLDATAYAPLNDEGMPTGRVVVTILSRENEGEPDDDLISVVTGALNKEDVRPLTDYVEVKKAYMVPYEVDAALYTLSGPDRDVVLSEAFERLDTYISERNQLGSDVTLSGIYRALHANGVQRVELRSPSENITVGNTEAAQCISISVIFGGVDE